MKDRLIINLCLSVFISGSISSAQGIKEVPLTDVKLSDQFWSPKLEINRTVTIPHDFKLCEETGRIANFERVARKEHGTHQGFFFNDSDLYKVIEAAAWSLAVTRDDKLSSYVDGVIAKIAAAQEADGYLYTFHQLGDPTKRFSNLKDRHELYCAGHLIEAGVAHFRATGKKNLLDVAVKSADLIDRTFGEGKRYDVDGHEEIELALFKLADATGQAKYRTLGEFFVHQRGRAHHRGGLYGPYFQDIKPVEQFNEVVGHAVRQMYLACAMTDMASVEQAGGGATMSPALDRMWTDLVDRKMYITGGVGAKHEGEAFGDAYDLPNESAYAETCAAIGCALWNHRMNLLSGDAKYADVVERISYNGMLAGVSLSGDKFFYVNPLASHGKHNRQSWYDCACCPPNVARFLATMAQRAVMNSKDAVYVNLYVAGETRVIRDGAEIRITQQTKYPWDGKVKLTIDPEPAASCAIKLRIPGWCGGDGAGGENGGREVGATLAVNGQARELNLDKGYATLAGPWKGGDVIELNLPMPARRVHADPRVKANTGRVAVQRGPIVYCAEGIDNAGKAFDAELAKDGSLSVEYKSDLLGGVSVIKSQASRPSLTFVPYYAWDNREAGEMAVWMREN